MARSLVTLRTELGRLVNDNTGATQAVHNLVRNDLINKANRWWQVNMERRTARKDLFSTVVTAPTSIYPSISAAIYPEILEVAAWLVIVSPPSEALQTVLQRASWEELSFWHESFPNLTTADNPTHYAVRKLSGGTGSPLAAENKWEFRVFPVPAAVRTVRGLVRLAPTALSADGDVPDLGDFEADCVVYIAGYWAASLQKNPDLAQTMLNFLPQMVQDKLAVRREAVAEGAR